MKTAMLPENIADAHIWRLLPRERAMFVYYCCHVDAAIFAAAAIFEPVYVPSSFRFASISSAFHAMMLFDKTFHQERDTAVRTPLSLLSLFSSTADPSSAVHRARDAPMRCCAAYAQRRSRQRQQRSHAQRCRAMSACARRDGCRARQRARRANSAGAPHGAAGALRHDAADIFAFRCRLPPLRRHFQRFSSPMPPCHLSLDAVTFH